MKNIYTLTTVTIFVLLATGIFAMVYAAEGYTKTITMDGQNNVEYTYTKHDEPNNSKTNSCNDSSKECSRIIVPDYYLNAHPRIYYPSYFWGDTYTFTGMHYGPSTIIHRPHHKKPHNRPPKKHFHKPKLPIGMHHHRQK